jgi:hypothetical protein
MNDPKRPPRPVASGSTLVPPRVFTHFALLDHELRDSDPGFWTDTGVRRDDHLQWRLDRMLSHHPKWAGLRVAIADLGSGVAKFAGNATPGSPAVTRPGETITAGERCLETWEAVSTSKIGILYAAYQLRREVISMAEGNPWITPEEVRDRLRIKWLDSQVIDAKRSTKVLREANPRVEVRGPEVLVDGKRIALRKSDGTTFGPPRLDRIFDIAKTEIGWKIRFKGEPDRWHDDEQAFLALARETHEAAYTSPLPARTSDTGRPFTFFDKLWLMADASHNQATDDVLSEIGFLYVNSVLWQSGLFAPQRGGGLWVGRHFARPVWWAAPPAPVVKTRDGETVRASCSAAAGVAFMTLLHQDKLVDSEACRHMKVMLARSPFGPKLTSWTGSPAGGGIARRDRDNLPIALDTEELFSKLGAGSFHNVSDAAYLAIRNPERNTTFRYAVSFFDVDLDPQLSTKLYDLIDVETVPMPKFSPSDLPPIPAPPETDEED